jgi:hypothetical protein
MNSKMTLAVTSLLLAGVLAVTYGCASSSEEDNGGSTGNSSSEGGGGGGGGDGGSSGSSGNTPSGDVITFASGQATGLFTGYGWVALGEKDSLSSPECDTGKPITKAEACTTSTVWSKTDALCMSGTIPALPSSPKQEDYDANWGVQIGVNAAEPPDQAGDVMKDYKTMTVTLSGEPKSGLRAMVHRKGDPDGTTYCLDSIKSGSALTLTKFNTKCWGDASTVLLSADDLPKIDKVGVQVSSGSAEIAVNDLCLEKVEFGK